MATSVTLTTWCTPWNPNEKLPEGVTTYKYYAIDKELPVYNNDAMQDMWLQGELYKTKLSEANVFKTRFAFISDLLKVYINGQLVSRNVIDNRTFTVEPTVGDGFMYVSYGMPFQITNRIIMSESRGVIIKQLPGSVSYMIIKEMRNAFNTLEQYLGIPTTLWLGGIRNDGAGTENLISLVTPISFLHLLELQEAYKRISRKVWVAVEGNLEMRTEFIEVQDDKNITCDMIEELRRLINELEQAIITHGG